MCCRAKTAPHADLEWGPQQYGGIAAMMVLPPLIAIVPIVMPFGAHYPQTTVMSEGYSFSGALERIEDNWAYFFWYNVTGWFWPFLGVHAHTFSMLRQGGLRHTTTLL